MKKTPALPKLRPASVVASAILVLVLASPVLAFEFPGGQLELPEGMDGPIEDMAGDNTRIYAFRKQNGEDLPDAQLQVTVWESEDGLPDYSEEELQTVTGIFLQQFFGGIEQTREEISTGSRENIELSGKPAVRMEWTGKMNEKPVTGMFYTVVHDQRVVVLHKQDYADSDTGFGQEIIQVLESVKLTENGE